MVEDQKFNDTVLTNIGHKMLTSLASGNKKITYTKAEAYSQDVSSIDNGTLQALTSLQGMKLSTNLLVSNENGNVVTITANFENKGLTSDAVFNSVGWLAELDTSDTENGITANQEYLIGITPANGAQTLVAPPADQSSSQTISLNLNMTLSDAASVNMTVSDAGTVHFNQLDDQLANYTTTSDLTKLLANKADLGFSYTKAELDAKLLNLTADADGKVSAAQVQTLIADKANSSDVYTKSQIDSDFATRDAQISTKANSSDVYTKSQIDGDFSARDAQINTKANTSDVYTKSDVDSALAADRGRLGKLEGAQTVDSPDFNSITATGVYYITNNTPANIKNNPTGSWGVLVVSNGNGNRTSQVYYPDDGSPQWCRLLNGSNWLPWYQLSTKNDVSNATNLANQAQATANTKANASDVYTKTEVDSKTVGNVVTAYDVASKNPTAVRDSYTNRSLVDQLALGQFSDAINDINGTWNRYTHNDGFDLLTLWGKFGIHYCHNSNMTNVPDWFTDKRGTAFVFTFDNNSQTMIYASCTGYGLAYYNKLEGKWHKLATDNDITDLQNNVYTKADIPLAFKGTLTSTDDMNKVLESGMYITQGAAPQNFPPSDIISHGSWGTILVYNHDAGQILQLWFIQGNVFHRWITNSAPQTEWQRYADQSDITDLQNQIQQLRDNQFEVQTFTDTTAAASWEAQKPGHRLAIIQS